MHGSWCKEPEGSGRGGCGGRAEVAAGAGRGTAVPRLLRFPCRHHATSAAAPSAFPPPRTIAPTCPPHLSRCRFPRLWHPRACRAQLVRGILLLPAVSPRTGTLQGVSQPRWLDARCGRRSLHPQR
eukprot:SM002932S11266  [mRNA]  locus=s2932:373:1581:+ [translate_table: standard]